MDRPITSGINGITEGISKIADHYMTQIINHIPAHLKESQALINDMNDLGALPPNAKLFRADATSIYTNIQPDIGINAIKSWMEAYPSTVPKDVPQALLIKLLEIIMRRNVFISNDTNWLQEIVTTGMGTPCACSYATPIYVPHEVQSILAAFSQFLMILKGFIDDMFGI